MQTATRADIRATSRDLRSINGAHDPDVLLTWLMERCLEREYPPHGALLDAIRALAACDPNHGTAWWCDAMDKVLDEVVAVEAAMRKERTNE